MIITGKIQFPIIPFLFRCAAPQNPFLPANSTNISPRCGLPGYSGALYLQTLCCPSILSILRHAVACLTVLHHSFLPFFHSSIFPLFHCRIVEFPHSSTLPPFHSSIFPFFHFSTIPLFHHSQSNEPEVLRTEMFVANKPAPFLNSCSAAKQDYHR